MCSLARSQLERRSRQSPCGHEDTPQQKAAECAGESGGSHITAKHYVASADWLGESPVFSVTFVHGSARKTPYSVPGSATLHHLLEMIADLDGIHALAVHFPAKRNLQLADLLFESHARQKICDPGFDR